VDPLWGLDIPRQQADGGDKLARSLVTDARQFRFGFLGLEDERHRFKERLLVETGGSSSAILIRKSFISLQEVLALPFWQPRLGHFLQTAVTFVHRLRGEDRKVITARVKAVGHHLTIVEDVLLQRIEYVLVLDQNGHKSVRRNGQCASPEGKPVKEAGIVLFE